MKKAGICIVAALVVISAIAPWSYSREASGKRELGSVQGVVNNVDWVGRKLTIRYVADRYVIMSNNYQDLTFLVTDDTKVTKAGEEYFFSNIEREDNITVAYYLNDSGMPVAVSINVNQE